jgi:hypothetical protein
MTERLTVCVADPPYPGQSKKHYGDHPDYAGEVDHAALVKRLCDEFDGWCLNTSSTALADVLALCPADVRVGAWVKPFAAFKRNVPVAYAWEPVIIRSARKPTVGGVTRPLRDFIEAEEQVLAAPCVREPITMRRGLVGAKPERVCHWMFEVMGALPTDDFHDLFPGSGAVRAAWDTWTMQLHNREVSA